MHRKRHLQIVMVGILEYLLLFPLLLTIALLALNEDIRSLWLFTLPFVFALAYFISTLITSNKRIVSVMTITIMSLIIGGLFCIFTSISFFLWPIFICIYTFIMFRAFAYREYDIDDLFKVHYFWTVALPCYFVGYFFYEHIEQLNQYRDHFQVAGILTLLVTLFISNHSMLRRATYSKEKSPVIGRSLTLQNRLFMVGTIVLLFLLANLGFVRDVLIFIRNAVGRVVLFFATLFSTDKSNVINDSPQVQQPAFPQIEPTEPSLLGQLLDKFASYLGLFLACVLLLVAILLIFRKLKSFLSRAIDYLKTLVNRLLPGDDRTDGVNIYIDEKESLLNVKSWFKNKANNVIQFVTTVSERRIKWSLLTNSEKVRYIYREMVMGQIKRGFVYRKDLTAHEVLSKIKMKQTEDSQSLQKLDQLYNAARYSDKPIEERKVMEVEKIGMKQ